MSSARPDTPVDARQRIRTLALTATLSTDSVALARIMERAVAAHQRRNGPGSARLVTFVSGGSRDAGADGWEHQRYHIWWTPPDRWREELIWPGGQRVVTVVQPHVALSYLSMHRALYTTAALPLAAPSRLLGLVRHLIRRRLRRAWPAKSVRLPTVDERVAEFPLTSSRLPASEWNVTRLGDEEYLGRTAHHMRAIRRAGSALDEYNGRTSGYWPWLDEYEYLVDDATGILLRLTGLADGVPVGRVTADEVHVDEPMPDDVFEFIPPPGTSTVQVARRT